MLSAGAQAMLRPKAYPGAVFIEQASEQSFVPDPRGAIGAVRWSAGDVVAEGIPWRGLYRAGRQASRASFRIREEPQVLSAGAQAMLWPKACRGAVFIG